MHLYHELNLTYKSENDGDKTMHAESNIQLIRN